MTLIEHLQKLIRNAAGYNPDISAPPACILWPDHNRQWEAVIHRLQGELPELLVLGDYAPEQRVGPAIWLRCVIAEKIPDVSLPEGCTPILYLPGVSRQDLRAVESCPDRLKPLAELQYRGVIWSQINAKDWTILAFLKSEQGGLGLDVAQDNDARSAMQRALPHLLSEDVELLRGKRLDKDYFNTLLTGGDPARDLLQWINEGDDFKRKRGENEWKAFVEVCKSRWAFNPDSEGLLAGATKLANHEGPWLAVWDRFCDSHKLYLNIPVQIRKCETPSFNLMTDANSAAGWPQWNEAQEHELNLGLVALDNTPPHEARKRLQEMEAKHKSRRQLVWAELGEAPLATAMEHLGVLSEITKDGLNAGTVDDMAKGYLDRGWRADDAVVQALSVVGNNQDFAAITSAVRAIYLPWAEESARRLQQVWKNPTNSVRRPDDDETEGMSQPECILFVDGLRSDCAKRLVALLGSARCTVTEKPVWAALPSVTGTGKPAVAPIAGSHRISEEPDHYNFEPLTPYQFNKAMEDNGWKIIRANEPIPSPIALSAKYAASPPLNRLWCEFGDIDHEGHGRGWKLSKQMDALLGEVRDRIRDILDAGWPRVKVVTDHGWLLLPGGLPKVELPSALSDNKWGRCAVVKPGASTDERQFSWFWNPNEHFALADGIGCYRSGADYAHGGLSLQECMLLELVVKDGKAQNGESSAQFTDIGWKGMRCAVAVDGQFAGLSLDIRAHAGDASSSMAVSIKLLSDTGTASVVVENSELSGQKATLVLLDANGGLVAQAATVIGGGRQ